MTNELLRLTSAWMKHPTNGLNAVLAVVPRDVGDPQPPAIVKFANESEDDVVARGQLPTEAPACVMVLDREPAVVIDDRVVMEIGAVDARVIVQISVDKNDTAQGVRDAGYYLRALAWVVRRWILQDVNSVHRKRNDFAILEIGRCELTPMWKEVEDRVVVAGIRIPLQCRDLAPA